MPRTELKTGPPRPRNPLDVLEWNVGPQVPDPITFIMSPQWLDRPQLYPRQATLIKLIFLRDDLFCADEETEILTRGGWRHYNEITAGEDVLTLSPDTGLAEWAPAEHVNVFPVQDKPVIRMDGVSHSSLTTPNHRWLVESANAPGKLIFVETKDLRKHHRIACAAPVANLPVIPQWDDAFVELVAWYWTEGSLITGHSGVKIGQSDRINPEYVSRIRRCLESLFGPASNRMTRGRSSLDQSQPMWREDPADAGMIYFRLNAAASEDLKWLVPGTDKIVDPAFITSLTKTQLELFISTSIDADGWVTAVRSSGKRSRAISQQVKGRLDILQMACSLAGIRTTLQFKPIRGNGKYAGYPSWVLNFLDERRHFKPDARPAGMPGKFKITEEKHSGFLWCPTTKNGTWLARRDGKVYFTGNTDYDHQVIAEWIQMFNETNPEAWPDNKFDARTNGIQPDIYERIEWCKSRGYRWFRELVLAIGRRGSKGYLCSLAMAYVVWQYLCLGNPQEHFGLDRDKQLEVMIFAGKREQAKANLWGDLYNVVTGAPCFTPYISDAQTELLSVYAPYDFIRMRKLAARGLSTTKDQASFRIVPRESTPLAPRGQAAAIFGFDEAAHVKNTGITREFGQVYAAASPALDQFGRDAFICLPSSTWEMTGYFYTLWELSLTREDDGSPLFANKLMVQLASWHPYADWEQAQDIPLFPPGFRGDLGEYAGDWAHPRLPRLKGAIQAYDEEMAKEERANPDTFSVERRSHWATGLDAYLNAAKADQMFAPWEGRLAEFGRPQLEMQSSGPLIISYRAHGDPSTVNNRFGFALAHSEPGPDGMNHAVFDLIHYWDPADFGDHIIDYDVVTDWIFTRIVEPFQPEEISFDQFNSVASVQRLQKLVRNSRLQKTVMVYERVATAPLNWKTYETFKVAVNMGLVHAPFHAEALQELKFLQKPEGQQKVIAPESGPVRTKDIADCLAIITYEMLGEQLHAFLAGDLRNQRPGTALQGGIDALARFSPAADQNPYAGQLGGLQRGVRPGTSPYPGMRGARRGNPVYRSRHRS
jgi:hypothetical protein